MVKSEYCSSRAVHSAHREWLVTVNSSSRTLQASMGLSTHVYTHIHTRGGGLKFLKIHKFLKDTHTKDLSERTICNRRERKYQSQKIPQQDSRVRAKLQRTRIKALERVRGGSRPLWGLGRHVGQRVGAQERVNKSKWQWWLAELLGSNSPTCWDSNIVKASSTRVRTPGFQLNKGEHQCSCLTSQLV